MGLSLGYIYINKNFWIIYQGILFSLGRHFVLKVKS